jgi:hypothetical protein
MQVMRLSTVHACTVQQVLRLSTVHPRTAQQVLRLSTVHPRTAQQVLRFSTAHPRTAQVGLCKFCAKVLFAHALCGDVEVLLLSTVHPHSAQVGLCKYCAEVLFTLTVHRPESAKSRDMLEKALGYSCIQINALQFVLLCIAQASRCVQSCVLSSVRSSEAACREGMTPLSHWSHSCMLAIPQLLSLSFLSEQASRLGSHPRYIDIDIACRVSTLRSVSLAWLVHCAQYRL